MILRLIVIFSLLGGLGSISVAGLFLLFPDRIRRILIPCLISYASGTLLAAAFLGLIPHALSHVNASVIFPTVLAGIVCFFVLEKLLLWRHCHLEACETHAAAGSLILIGDAFHNFADGLVMTAAFLTSVPLGIATSVAIIVHEVPQEVGDFAILLHSGYSRARAFVYNALSSLTAVLGAVLAYLFLREVQSVIPYVMGISASSFIYISTVDLLPGLHQQTRFATSARQVALILLGIGTIFLFHLHE